MHFSRHATQEYSEVFKADQTYPIYRKSLVAINIYLFTQRQSIELVC